MAISFHKRPRRVVVSIAIGLWCVVASGCSTTEPVASEDTALRGLEYLEATTAPAADEVEPAPTSLPFVDEAQIDAVDTEDEVEATSELPRTTATGIRIAKSFEREDLGEGEVDTVYFSARRGSGLIGLYIDPEFAAETTESTDSQVWGSSSGIFLVVFVTEPGVTEMTLTSRDGQIDRAAPDADGVVVLAVPGNKPDDVTAEAVDADGNVVATCGPEGQFGFLGCW